MNSAKAGIVGGAIGSWGSAICMFVVDHLTPWDAPVAAYLILLSVGVTLGGAHLNAWLNARRFDEVVRRRVAEANMAEAYRLALLTVGESLRPQHSTELPRVAGDDYPRPDAAPTVPIRRRPQLIHDSTRRR